MQDREKLELFKAALAVAAADKELKRSEMGLVEGLAAKVGIGKASFDAMVSAALQGDSIAGGLAMDSPETARKAMQLLVAEARIDGEISEEERRLLLWISGRLKLSPEEFQEIYRAGIKQADDLRRRQ